MKKTLLLLALFSSFQSFSQNYSDTMVFQDGTKIPFYSYNENDDLAKYTIAFNPISPLFMGENTIFMFNLSGFVRVTPSLLVEGKISKAYSASSDNLLVPSAQKGSYEIFAAGHYLFRTNAKSKKYTVDFGFANYENNNHVIKAFKPEMEFERIVKYYFSGGIDLLRTSGNYRVASLTETETSFGTSNFFIGNINSFSVLGGVMRETVLNYQYGYENTYGENKYSTSKRKTKRMRTYAYLTFAPVVNYNVYDRVEMKEITSGYYDVTNYRRLGWRFGADMKLASFKAGPFVGFELGRVHGVKVPQHDFFGSSYFSVKLGAELGVGYKKLGLKKSKK